MVCKYCKLKLRRMAPDEGYPEGDFEAFDGKEWDRLCLSVDNLSPDHIPDPQIYKLLELYYGKV